MGQGHRHEGLPGTLRPGENSHFREGFCSNALRRSGHLTGGVCTLSLHITSRPRYPGCPKLLGLPGGLQSQSFPSFSPSLGLAGLVAVRSCGMTCPHPLCHLPLNPRNARLWGSEPPASYGLQALQSTGMGWGQEEQHYHLCIHRCPGQAPRLCPSYYLAPDGVEQ